MPKEDLIYLNAQSLIAHKDQIVYEIAKIYPSLILLSEARVTSDIQTCEVAIDQYHMLRCGSVNRHTGGVVMYIKLN